jgi:hypothetical protein
MNNGVWVDLNGTKTNICEMADDEYYLNTEGEISPVAKMATLVSLASVRDVWFEGIHYRFPDGLRPQGSLTKLFRMSKRFTYAGVEYSSRSNLEFEPANPIGYTAHWDGKRLTNLRLGIDRDNFTVTALGCEPVALKSLETVSEVVKNMKIAKATIWDRITGFFKHGSVTQPTTLCVNGITFHGFIEETDNFPFGYKAVWDGCLFKEVTRIGGDKFVVNVGGVLINYDEPLSKFVLIEEDWKSCDIKGVWIHTSNYESANKYLIKIAPANRKYSAVSISNIVDNGDFGSVHPGYITSHIIYGESTYYGTKGARPFVSAAIDWANREMELGVVCSDIQFHGDRAALALLCNSKYLDGFSARWNSGSFVDLTHTECDNAFVLKIGNVMLALSCFSVNDNVVRKKDITEEHTGMWLYTGGDYLVKIADSDGVYVMSGKCEITNYENAKVCLPNSWINAIVRNNICYQRSSPGQFIYLAIDWADPILRRSYFDMSTGAPVANSRNEWEQSKTVYHSVSVKVGNLVVSGDARAVSQCVKGSIDGLMGKWTKEGITELKLLHRPGFLLRVGSEAVIYENLKSFAYIVCSDGGERPENGIWVYTGGSFLVKIAKYHTFLVLQSDGTLHSGEYDKVNPTAQAKRIKCAGATFIPIYDMSIIEAAIAWSDVKKRGKCFTVGTNMASNKPKKVKYDPIIETYEPEKKVGRRYVDDNGDIVTEYSDYEINEDWESFRPQWPKAKRYPQLDSTSDRWWQYSTWRNRDYTPPKPAMVPGEVLSEMNNLIKLLNGLNTNGFDKMVAAMDNILAGQSQL